MVPKCEECGKNMEKIIVDFEEDDMVLTAYECPDCQTITELSKQSIDELIQEGFPILRSVKEIMEIAGTLSVPLDERIANILRIQKGQRVETLAVDNKHIWIKVA